MKLKVNTKLLGGLTAVSISLTTIGGLKYYNSEIKESEVYISKDNEYWVNEKTYNQYVEYTTVHPPKTERGSFDTDVEMDGEIFLVSYPLYELCEAEKFVSKHVTETYELSDGTTEKYSKPVYDFHITKIVHPDIESEIVLASDGFYYYETPYYEYDRNGHKVIIEGSAIDKIEDTLEKYSSNNKSK